MPAVQLVPGDDNALRVTNAINKNADEADASLKIANNLSDVASAATAFAAIKQTATSSATGVVQIGTHIREKLTGGRTYYVRSDGSDSNTGLVDSAGGAFLTVQKAIDVVAALDISIYNVTIQLAASTTYSENILVNGPWLGSGVVTLLGGNSSSTIVTCASGDTLRVINNGALTVSTFEVRCAAGQALRVESGGHLTIGASMRFGAINQSGVYVDSGGSAYCRSSYTIAGNAAYHLQATLGGVIDIAGITITLSGTPAFGGFYAVAAYNATIQHHVNTFSGSATGARYSVSGNSVIFTNGAGATYLPGNAGGSTATGGQYI